MAALRDVGVVRNQQFSFRDASGASRDGLISGEIIQLDGEQVALTTMRDVTEINKIQQRLALIYDTVGDVVFLVAVEDDGAFRFESVNKRFAATTGLPSSGSASRK
jgi:PAS domain-containing protein